MRRSVFVGVWHRPRLCAACSACSHGSPPRAHSSPLNVAAIRTSLPSLGRLVPQVCSGRPGALRCSAVVVSRPVGAVGFVLVTVISPVWECYERAVRADGWSAAEPSAKLVELCRERLSPSIASCHHDRSFGGLSRALVRADVAPMGMFVELRAIAQTIASLVRPHSHASTWRRS